MHAVLAAGVTLGLPRLTLRGRRGLGLPRDEADTEHR